MLVVDKFNEVGNNFAISSQGIGEALLRSASALAAGNNTLDGIALITTANTIVQGAGLSATIRKLFPCIFALQKPRLKKLGKY